MSDEAKWKAALSPNYKTNKDKLYPYSELPYLGDYKLFKIPCCIKNLIEHVDYFGQGRIEIDSKILGFPDSYNVNDEYKLVQDGQHGGRKIPNRIPIAKASDSACTRSYLKDNSVRTVTICYKYSRDTLSVAQDITRIVNGDVGIVILYGFNENSSLTEFVSQELKKMKQLFYNPTYLLPEHLKLSFYGNNYIAYLPLNELKKELYSNVKKGNNDAAILLTGCLNDVYCCNALGDVVNKLIENNVINVMVYAYKLWNTNAKDIVCKYFPPAFKLILNGDCMTIINKQYNQALKLEEPNKMRAWGDSTDKTSNKVSWKIIPTWEDDKLLFKLQNNDSDMFLHLSPTSESNGDRQVWGSKDCKELRYHFYLEPAMVDGHVAFIIFNCEFGKCLKLSADIDVGSEDRAVIGHEGDNNNQDKRFCWILEAWNQLDEDDEPKEIAHECFDNFSS